MVLFRYNLLTLVVFCLSSLNKLCLAGDPTVSYELHLEYKTLYPLGLPQQVIAVNGEFPGPLINTTTNNNVVVNVWNGLDEGLLLSWAGVQLRHNSWQDGVPGTNCPIPPGRNFTYRFQVKDQIGSYYYFPSTHFQRASGGFGPLVINNRPNIAVPFALPDGDITILIGDWFISNHKALRANLDAGKDLGMPDGVLINGKGPFRYNDSIVPDGIVYETINVDPGKTYRIRVHNVGISTSLNFRIQSHNLLLAETEGHYTMMQNYTSIDIHVGQSYSFLLSTDQNATTDYYIVASARFVNETIWEKVTGVAILHYSNSQGPVVGPLPSPPDDFYSKEWSMNQARSIRQNGSASGARPNPQGSFHYGQINVTDVYVLKNVPPLTIDGKLRATLNGISFVNPKLPIRLADKHNVKGAYKLDFPIQPRTRPPVSDISVINATYKGYVEIILQNNDTYVQSFHMDGYSFFVVGMSYGEWNEGSRGQYNKWDAVSRSTIQVYPGAWTAILVFLDNTGVWNLRTSNLDRWYLGQETYMKVVDPEENGDTEMDVPTNVIYCGPLDKLNKYHRSSANPGIRGRLALHLVLVLILSVIIFR